MIRNVLFDWSGTLSDDQRSVYAAMMGVFRRLNLPVISLEEFRREFVLPYADFDRKYTDAPTELIDKLFIEEYRLVTKPALFSDAASALAQLHGKRIRIGILSSQQQVYVEKEITAFGLAGVFDVVCASVADKRTAIASVLSENHFSPSEIAFVGDMTHDIDAGHAAGVTTIGVTWGYQSREKLSTAHPDFIVDSFEELRSLILSSADKKGI